MTAMVILFWLCVEHEKPKQLARDRKLQIVRRNTENDVEDSSGSQM